MPMCSRPGCVAQAVNGSGFCSVHAHPAGKACARCRGTGSYFYRGQDLTMACQTCGGTGLIDQKTSAPRRKPKDDPIEQRGLIQVAEGDDA